MTKKKLTCTVPANITVKVYDTDGVTEGQAPIFEIQSDAKGALPDIKTEEKIHTLVFAGENGDETHIPVFPLCLAADKERRSKKINEMAEIESLLKRLEKLESAHDLNHLKR